MWLNSGAYKEAVANAKKNASVWLYDLDFSDTFQASKGKKGLYIIYTTASGGVWETAEYETSLTANIGDYVMDIAYYVTSWLYLQTDFTGLECQKNKVPKVFFCHSVQAAVMHVLTTWRNRPSDIICSAWA